MEKGVASRTVKSPPPLRILHQSRSLPWVSVAEEPSAAMLTLVMSELKCMNHHTVEAELRSISSCTITSWRSLSSRKPRRISFAPL